MICYDLHNKNTYSILCLSCHDIHNKNKTIQNKLIHKNNQSINQLWV